MVKLSETVPSGSAISLAALLDCNPYIVNKEFNFRVGKIRESFEASSFNVFPWINISSIPWVVTSETSKDGIVSARSGAISHSGSTSLSIRTIYSKNDSLRFYYKVSSEPNYDYLSFKLNGEEIFKKSGEISWTKQSVAVQAGVNKMEWIYRKDNSVSQGSDCAWIDMIDFAQTSPVSYIQKDLQVARIVKPAKNEVLGMQTISVKVLNPGKNIIDGFNLAYNINNHIPVSQHFDNKVMPSGDSVVVSFSVKADMSKYGVYKVTAFGFDNNDDFLLNDTLTAEIENTKINETISVYPNPFSDRLTISINSPVGERLHISLTNVSGIKVYDIEKDIMNGNNSIIISDSKITPALYYLNIYGTSINKIVPVVKLNR